jgi:hypothetical protein
LSAIHGVKWLSEEVLAVGTVFKTEPVRWLSGPGESSSRILATAGMLAPVMLNAGSCDGLYGDGKADLFVAHWEAIKAAKLALAPAAGS